MPWILASAGMTTGWDRQVRNFLCNRPSVPSPLEGEGQGEGEEKHRLRLYTAGQWNPPSPLSSVCAT